MTIRITFLHPDMTPDHLGLLPLMLNDANPACARDQLDQNYRHGGGWRPFEGFKMNQKDFSIKYPGDPAHHPLALIEMRDEKILFYEHAWVAIIKPDKSFEICRMD